MNISKFFRIILITLILLNVVACSKNRRIVENEKSNIGEAIDTQAEGSDANENEITEQISDKVSITFKDFEIYNSESITYDELEYISEETFKTIMKIEDNIDYIGGILNVDLSESVLLRERYLKVLKGKESYTNCLENKGYSDLIEYDPKDIEKYSYYYFDVNGDEVPEVIVFGDMRYALIFSYREESGNVKLCDIIKLGNSFFLGNNKFGTWNGGTGLTYEFYELGKDEEREAQVYFHSEGYYNNTTQEENEIYMVGFGEGTKELEELKHIITDKVEQIYEENATYYLKISKEEYDHITSDFFDSREASEEKLSDVMYTYEELFGDVQQ